MCWLAGIPTLSFRINGEASIMGEANLGRRAPDPPVTLGKDRKIQANDRLSVFSK
jgi:hypothetical protein